MTDKSDAVKNELRQAWDQMIESLQEARNAIDQPELMPAPSSEHTLAEGYRYLAGYLHSAIERSFHEDKLRPQFRNALSIINRGTIDNADAIYFYAPIDGSLSYKLSGHTADSRHWRGEPALDGQAKAPNYLIFEASSGGLAGDTGHLSELRPGTKTQTGRLDSSSIQVDSDGYFEILLAPEKPADFKGNYICTLKIAEKPHPSDSNAPAERYADYISGRQLFHDWNFEEAIHFEIAPLDNPESFPARYNSEQAAKEIRQLGELVRNQMHFWNAFWTIPMGAYGEREGTIAGTAFPKNGFNKVNAASGATGGGMSTNLYAGGVFELAEDEALVIENTIPIPPQYYGFQLSNLWGESLDYGNRLGSLNSHQLHIDDDGIIRMVVSHNDPMVANWLDTSELSSGFLTARWAYSKKPDEAQWPTISVKKVQFKELSQLLPSSTPAISNNERRLQILARQRHVKKRFRAF